MPVPNSLHALTPSQLLCVTQSAGPDADAACAAVLDTYGDVLDKLTAKVCQRYFLNKQDREEVLAETYQQLVDPDIARFRPSRGKPEKYFKGLVQNAARKVMRQRDARRRKGDAGERDVAKPADVNAAADQPAGWPVTPPAPLGPAEEAEQHDTVKYILKQAPPRVRRALELSYWDEWSIQSIAAHLGVSRFALTREIRAFFVTMNERLGDG